MLQLVREAVSEGPTAGVSADADERQASLLLKQFLFPPSRWHSPVAKLSGGERRRLQLLQVLARQPNVLLLDEPTNDLDLDTIAVLETFLQTFAGVLIIVSHDRYFLDKVVDHLFVLSADGSAEVRDWGGSFSEYLEYTDAAEAEEKAQARQRAKAVEVTNAGDSAEAPLENAAVPDAGSSAGKAPKSLKPLTAF